MDESYSYVPLQSVRGTRAIRLKPSKDVASTLQCSLQEISLDNPTSFVALSYVWGSPKGTKPLICEGKTIMITPNGEDAFRYIRQAENEVTIWVDAVCIDQSSVLEKNQQVPMMHEIYGKAEKVIIWLGKGDDKIEHLFRKLETLRRCQVYYVTYKGLFWLPDWLKWSVFRLSGKLNGDMFWQWLRVVLEDI
jgi:hypothetical protein